MFKVAYHPIYGLPLPEGHRFPMEKYELIQQQLLHEGTCDPEDFFEPGLPQDQDVLAVHDHEYFQDLKNLHLSPKQVRRIGLPISELVIARELRILQGSIRSAAYALKDGISMNIAGGTHHAYTDQGEGFCLLNDQAVAARWLQRKGLARKILIIDLDVHQGNGTAEIFSGDPTVFTFSMHGKHNYPFQKAHSDRDVALEDGTDDDIYMRILEEELPGIFDRVKPDFVFYQSGVDILESDKLGRISCTLQGCRRRDWLVFETCKKFGIPVQVSLGGGYSRSIKDIVEAHANTFRIARHIFA